MTESEPAGMVIVLMIVASPESSLTRSTSNELVVSDVREIVTLVAVGPADSTTESAAISTTNAGIVDSSTDSMYSPSPDVAITSTR